MAQLGKKDFIAWANRNGFSDVILNNEEISTAKVKSALHRLNDRLQQFQKKGYTDSTDYDQLLNSLQSLSGNRVTFSSKTKRLNLSETTKNLTFEDVRQILKLGGRQTVKYSDSTKKFYQLTVSEAKRRATNHLKELGNTNPTDADIKEQLSKENRVHDFIAKNALDIYKVVELRDAVRRPWNEKLSLEEVENLLNMYNNQDYYNENGEFVGNVIRDSNGVALN